MFGVLLSVIFFVISIASCQIWFSDNSPRDDSIAETKNIHQARFFPLFSVVRFQNSECAGNNNLSGTCYTKRECSKYGGSPCGTCANSLGVCCVLQKTCGSTSRVNNTYFINPSYPSSYSGGDRCTISIYPCSSNIRQLRIDFISFSLAQPNGTGYCDLDFMIVSGGSSKVPRICGENSNQHVYVEFNQDNPITLSIDSNSEFQLGRQWNLRLQQIEFDAPWLAPNGCLQYYSIVMGSAMSFNYGTASNPRDSEGTRQLTNANYGICIRTALGYCSIQWSQTNSYSFTVSNDTTALDDNIIGMWYSALAGENCTTNYVVVINPNINGTDRFCGNAFVTKLSSTTPFILTVVTNGEPYKTANRGFQLTWKQQACAV